MKYAWIPFNFVGGALVGAAIGLPSIYTLESVVSGVLGALFIGIGAYIYNYYRR